MWLLREVKSRIHCHGGICGLAAQLCAYAVARLCGLFSANRLKHLEEQTQFELDNTDSAHESSERKGCEKLKCVSAATGEKFSK